MGVHTRTHTCIKFIVLIKCQKCWYSGLYIHYSKIICGNTSPLWVPSLAFHLVMLFPGDICTYRCVRFLIPNSKKNENDTPSIILFSLVVPSFFIINLQIVNFPKFVCMKRPHAQLLVRSSLNLNGGHDMGWKSQIRALKNI